MTAPAGAGARQPGPAPSRGPGVDPAGDHWEPKDEKGPSDAQAKGGRATNRETAGGVDVEGHTKKELYERASKLNISGRSSMTKMELGQAIARKQD